MGLCSEFGTVIATGCAHRMQAGEASCRCPGCGVECEGLYAGCGEVWARRSLQEQPVDLAAKPSVIVVRANTAVAVSNVGDDARVVAAAPAARADDRLPMAQALVPPAPSPPAVGEESGDEKADDRATRLRADVDAMRDALERSVEKMEAELAARADEIDTRAAEHLRSIELDRTSLPDELRRALASVLPDIVASTVDQALEARPQEHPDLHRTVAAAVARANAGLGRLVAETVARALDAHQTDQPAIEQFVTETVGRSLDARQTDNAGIEQLVTDAVARALDAPQADQPVLERLVAESVARAFDARRAEEPALEQVVAEIVRLALDARQGGQASPEDSGGSRLRSEHDAIVEVRQRSLDKRVEGLTRRTQEIDDRVTTRLRAVDDDRAVLSDLARRQDELARDIAGAVTVDHHDRLAARVDESVPAMVADAVRDAMEAHSSALDAAQQRAEQAHAEIEARGAALLGASERTLETLFRRDQEIDEVAAAHRQALEDERATLDSLLEGGRDGLALTLLGLVPPIVDDAVRTAMERYATERRSGVMEIADRVRADSDVMREALQRSFEKMMEAVALREQALDDRAAVHLRALEFEKGALAELRAQVAGTLREAVPAMVGDAVRSALDLQRADLDEARKETERLRAQSEATTVELREALAELRATMARRDVEQQAAAYERALEGMRVAMGMPAAITSGRPADKASPGNGRPADKGSPGNGRPADKGSPGSGRPADKASPGNGRPAEKGSPGSGIRTPDRDPDPSASVTAAATATPPVDETNGGRVQFGRSVVPRSKRVERRMLRIKDDDDDERDTSPWRPLDSRRGALADLLESPDASGG